MSTVYKHFIMHCPVGYHTTCLLGTEKDKDRDTTMISQDSLVSRNFLTEKFKGKGNHDTVVHVLSLKLHRGSDVTRALIK